MFDVVVVKIESGYAVGMLNDKGKIAFWYQDGSPFWKVVDLIGPVRSFDKSEREQIFDKFTDFNIIGMIPPGTQIFPDDDVHSMEKLVPFERASE